MTNIGYYYPPQPPETDRDRYEIEFDNWLNERYDVDTGTILGLHWEDAQEDDEVFQTFMDEHYAAREI
jgi:hypothetical protein